MSRTNDLCGNEYGDLKVIKREGSNKWGKALWRCKCKCGKEIMAIGTDLKRLHTTSCGCGRIKHNLRNHRLYSIWSNMKNRCNSRTNTNYKHYGGRGIKVCTSWNDDFIVFYNCAIENGYSDNLTIDRINVDCNYEPSNCRWVTMEEQSLNKRISPRNSTGVTGVQYIKRSDNYHAYININRKRINLGYFKTKEEAVKARKEAEIKYIKQP